MNVYFSLMQTVCLYMNSSYAASTNLWLEVYSSPGNIVNRLLMAIAIKGSKSSVSKSFLHSGAYINETGIFT